MAAVAPVLFPEMRRRGANEGELVALLATSAAMSETIPPSLVLIMIGSVTGVSISALFTGGLLPALVGGAGADGAGVVAVAVGGYEPRAAGAVAHCAACLRGRDPGVVPAVRDPRRGDGRESPPRPRSPPSASSTAWWSASWCTAAFRCGGFIPILVDAASLSGAILLIIGAATAMAWALTRSGFSQRLVELAVGAPGGAVGFWIASIVLFGVLGKRVGGHSRDRAVRAAACFRRRGRCISTRCITPWSRFWRWAPGCSRRVRRGVLCSLRDQAKVSPDVAMAEGLALYRGAAGWAGCGDGGALVVDWVLVARERPGALPLDPIKGGAFEILN